MSDLPVVCVFGVTSVELSSCLNVPAFEETRLDCRCYLTDNDLYRIIARDRPVSIVSFGDCESFPFLMSSPLYIRKMWINIPDTDDLAKAGEMVFNCFMGGVLDDAPSNPKVTVFTSAYMTGDRILRPYSSLLNQTCNEWEWVVIDDSADDYTFGMLSELAESDGRIKLFRDYRHSGVIGYLKRQACMLGNGDYLLELDHDDELSPRALELTVEAFENHPECGFVYSDFAECFEDGSPVMYGKNPELKPPHTDWGFGYGSYRKEVVNGQVYMVANAPNVNAKTIRHIVAAPNHLRAWRRSFYIEIGGHNQRLHVADDYELMVRTFLKTRMCRIPEMCYVQYRNFQEGNTHRTRNKDIQRLVRHISQRYDRQIHERFLELGVDDFVWSDDIDSFFRLNMIPNPKEESHCTITVNS